MVGYSAQRQVSHSGNACFRCLYPALLDEANTSAYGHPEVSQVNIWVGTNAGILITGHDLVELEELLEQTEGQDIDVYTHSEMLPANYYPKLKKYEHLRGNYGNAWWLQKEEIANFNGPVLFTSNCLVPPRGVDYTCKLLANCLPNRKGLASKSGIISDIPRSMFQSWGWLLVFCVEIMQPAAHVAQGAWVVIRIPPRFTDRI